MSRLPPPQDSPLERALDEIESFLDQGEPSEALDRCLVLLKTAPNHPSALYLAGEASHELGDLERAEEYYRRCTQLVPDHAQSWSGLCACLFDQLRFDDCDRAAQRALRVDDTNPEAYYIRALLRERRGDSTGSARDYRRAWRLDPERYPRPATLDDATIEAVVVEALRDCPDDIREAVRNVPILLEELPSDEVCLSFEPPRSPIDILGLFSGPSLLERSFDDPWASVPATITLYRKNLERLGADRQRLLDEVRVTLLHEIGHYLGLSEEDLHARGLD